MEGGGGGAVAPQPPHFSRLVNALRHSFETALPLAALLAALSARVTIAGKRRRLTAVGKPTISETLCMPVAARVPDALLRTRTCTTHMHGVHACKDVAAKATAVDAVADDVHSQVVQSISMGMMLCFCGRALCVWTSPARRAGGRASNITCIIIHDGGATPTMLWREGRRRSVRPHVQRHACARRRHSTPTKTSSHRYCTCRCMSALVDTA